MPRNEIQDKKFLYVIILVGVVVVLLGGYKRYYTNNLRQTGIETTGTCVSFVAHEECVEIDEYSESCYDVYYPVVVFFAEGVRHEKEMSCNVKGGTMFNRAEFKLNDAVPIIYHPSKALKSAQINNSYCLQSRTNYIFYFALGIFALAGFFYLLNLR